MMRRKITTWVLVGVAIAIPTSCGPQEWGLERPADDDSSFDRLRERQLVRVVNASGNVEAKTVDELIDDLLDPECEARLDGEPGDGDACAVSNTGEPCGDAACTATREICLADLLIEISSISTQPTTLEGGETIPAQSSATNAALLEEAAVRARLSFAASSDGIRTALGFSGSAACTEALMMHQYSFFAEDGTTENRLRSQVFGTAYVTAYELAREATLRAVDLNVAVADGHFSTAANEHEAAELAASAPILSRAHGAHLLIGGEEGLSGLLAASGATGEALSVAFCTSAHPSSQTNAAIAAIREAAPPPTEITKPYANTIHDFLVTGPDSIRSRIIAGRGLSSSDFSPVAEEFAAELGLEVSDFVAARNHLAEQHFAFGRSTGSIFLPPRALGGGVSVTNLHASTATVPTIPDLEYYAWMSRDYPNGVPLGNLPDESYGDEGWAPLCGLRPL